MLHEKHFRDLEHRFELKHRERLEEMKHLQSFFEEERERLQRANKNLDAALFASLERLAELRSLYSDLEERYIQDIIISSEEPSVLNVLCSEPKEVEKEIGEFETSNEREDRFAHVGSCRRSQLL